MSHSTRKQIKQAIFLIGGLIGSIGSVANAVDSSSSEQIMREGHCRNRHGVALTQCIEQLNSRFGVETGQPSVMSSSAQKIALEGHCRGRFGVAQTQCSEQLNARFGVEATQQAANQ